MPDFKTLLTAHHAVLDDEGCALHYGNPVEELGTLRRAAVVALRNDLGILAITGPDAGDFLHRLTANDVKALPLNAGHDNLFLNAKGRILAEFRLFRIDLDGAPTYLALTPQPCAKSLADLLEKYHFGEKLTVVDRRAAAAASALSVVAVYGRAALDTLGHALAGGELPTVAHQILAYSAASADRATVAGWMIALPTATYGVPGIELLLPAAAAASLFQALRQAGLPAIGLAALGAASLEAAHPRFGADFDDQTMPPEAGLSHAYSLKKGCYIGQEVMARIQTYGHVNRQLTALRILGDHPVPRNAELYDGDAKVGLITSSIFSPTLNHPIALGYVNLKHRETGKQLTVRIDPATAVSAEIAAGTFV